MKEICKNINKILLDENNKTFFLFCHEMPDGDALGAITGFKAILETYFKKYGRSFNFAFNEAEYENISVMKKYFFLPHIKGYIDSKNFFEKIDGDVGIFFESSNFSRAGFLDENIKLKKIINIDHHAINDFYGDINWVDSSMSSTCEMVYLFLKNLELNITKDIATSLYTGILTDTGNFQYSNMKPDIYSIIKDLVEKGLDVNYIYRQIFGTNSKKHVFFEKELLNHLEFFDIENVKFSYSYIDEDFIERNKISSADIYGGSDYLRNIEDVDISIFVKPKSKNEYKFSMRSNGKYKVSEISKLFDGGGHAFAAGFSIEAEDVFDAKGKFLKVLREKFSAENRNFSKI